MGSSKLGNLSAKIGQYLPSSKNGDSHAGVSDMPDNQLEPAGPNGASSSPTANYMGHRLPDDGLESSSSPDQLMSLFNSVQNQAIDLQCQLAKATSDWTLALGLLTGRVATLEPLLNGALNISKERERVIEELSTANKEIKQKLADSDRDLLHFRP